MQEVNRKMLIDKASELLNDGTVSAVLGWKKGDYDFDMTPGVFTTADQLEKEFIFNDFCGANLSKYLVKLTRKTEGKVLVFLKPCDTYSLNQLITEHRVDRDKVFCIGIGCNGKISADKIRRLTEDTAVSASVDGDMVTVKTAYGETLTFAKDDCADERCLTCKSKKHVIYDLLLGEDGDVTEAARFTKVEELEKLSPEERFEFWQNELSRCIRCNACRNVCPACTCEKCVFDNPASGVENKAAANEFEEKMFHIIRAFHVAGRCTDCGECSRVCPQNIPLHLLNRKFIKDINEFYGEYQAGAVAGSRAPLVNYTFDDIEPSEATERGESNA